MADVDNNIDLVDHNVTSSKVGMNDHEDNDDNKNGFDDNDDVDFGDDDDDFGDDDPDFADDNDGFDDGDDDFGDDDGGWGDDAHIDVDNLDEQQYIPLDKSVPDEDADGNDSETFELDDGGNVISPKGASSRSLKRQKSQENQCWQCSHCKAINNLMWTLKRFEMKCCICKQATYQPTVKIFDAETWDEPSNDFWECGRCTLHNLIGLNQCEACQETNDQQINESDADDEENETGNRFSRDDDDDDDDDGGMMGGIGGMRGRMGGMGGMGGMYGMGGMRGMRGMGGMGGTMDIMQMMGLVMNRGGAGMYPDRGGMMGNRNTERRKKQTSKPFSKPQLKNLRNLLIVGFIRNCDIPQLPHRFFEYFNKYYQIFDRWDYDLFYNSWYSKKNDLTTIRRNNRNKGNWANMFGLMTIMYDPNKDKYPTKYSWKLRINDRMQQQQIKNTENENENAENEIDDDNDNENDDAKKKDDKYDFDYINVMIGVINDIKLMKQLGHAFILYPYGYGLFAGNGKMYKHKNWIKHCKPLKHKDTITINIEWMLKSEYDKSVNVGNDDNDDKKKKIKKKKNDEDDDDDDDAGDESTENEEEEEDHFICLLTYNVNDEPNTGQALEIPGDIPLRLGVCSAKKRYEIEWISSNWNTDNFDKFENKKNENNDNIDLDDIKDDDNDSSIRLN